jgi:hypothetical protein
MSEIKVENGPSEEKLKELGVFDWPIWSEEVSVFRFQLLFFGFF